MATPTIGRNFTLTFSISGVENHKIVTTTYRWKKDGTLLSDQLGPNLFFSPLRLSDVGQYTCNVTINNSIMKHSDVKDIVLTSITI